MSRYIDIENFCENLCHCNNEYCDKSNCPILNAPTVAAASGHMPATDKSELIEALRRLSAETGSLACLGCGHEHNCGIHGCAIIKEAAERISKTLDIGDLIYIVDGGKVNAEKVNGIVYQNNYMDIDGSCFGVFAFQNEAAAQEALNG